MKDNLAYQRKIETFKAQTLYPVLDSESKSFIDELVGRYQFTFQEFRQLSEAARDLNMWGEEALQVHWDQLEQQLEVKLEGVQRKERLLRSFRADLAQLKQSPKSYPASGLKKPKRAPLNVVSKESTKPILGECPVASPKTVCCNLLTLDAVENCSFGCSYCTIQTFYDDDVVFHKNFREKLEKLELKEDRFYHIGTGQSSDALVWGNREGILDDLCDFAARYPKILLEFKTKSKNVSYFLEQKLPKNVVCSWTLNTDTIINSEEHFTANLDQRLKAARAVADCGIKVAFHFHPIVYYDNWEEEYAALCARVLGAFSPAEVLFISFGSITFIKPVIQEIRKRGEPTKILQMELVPDPHGKLTYPDEVKLQLFHALNKNFTPWHESVYRYLCMERSFFWDEVFGWHYENNEEFERDFGTQVLKKL
ncbi:DNA photolyase [Oligoflexia bacterium]|nr:DNA photolyase [Oligoflexia bacterium]